MQARTASNIKGIDVSHHQGSIDWKKVAAAGVKYVFIKATEGASMTDLKLSSNQHGAAAAGLKIGFYHYARPEYNAPETEAANFFRNVKQYKTDFPLVLDVEGEAMAQKVGAAALTTWCVTFLNALEKLSGSPAMIYTGASFARSYLGAALAKWPLWVAHYGKDTPMSNDKWSKWAVFQYAENGKVAGIAGNVDMNAMEAAFFSQPPVTVPASEDTIKVVVNDKLAAHGRMIENAVYAPLRELCDFIGGVTVHWDAVSSTAYVNGKALTQFKMVGGKTYAGVRDLGSLLGAKVSWDAGTQKVYIYL